MKDWILYHSRRNKKVHTTNPNYRGTIELKPSRTADKRGIRIINEIYMEDYLKQVVPSEMPQSFGVEALKAQAVALELMH